MTPLTSASIRKTDYEHDAKHLATTIFNLWLIDGSRKDGPVVETVRMAIANVPWIVDQHPELQQLR